jgi:phosphoribosylpyrophosphate synthetase
MKVLKNIAITLSLAVPLTLVSADEVRTAVDAHTGKVGDNTSRDIKEVLIATPMTFKDIVVEAPRLERSVVVTPDINGVDEVAFNE